MMFDWLQVRKETQVPLDLQDLLEDQEGQDCLVALDLKVLETILEIEYLFIIECDREEKNDLEGTMLTYVSYPPL